MKRRWLLGFGVGALTGASMGALAAALTPGEPLDGIALGVMVSVLGWMGAWLWVCASLRLGRCILYLVGVSTLSLLIAVWRMSA